MVRSAVSYREKAEELRTISEDFSDAGARQMLARLASDYDNLAEGVGRISASRERPRVVSLFGHATAATHDDDEVQTLRYRLFAAEAALVERDKLRARLNQYRGLFDAIDEGVAIAELIRDDEGRPTDIIYREFNEPFERHSRLNNALNRRITGVLPNVDPGSLEQYARISDTGLSECSEDYLPDAGRYCRRHMSRIGGPGSPLVATVIEDITARKLAEVVLREIEERATMLLKVCSPMRPLAEPANARRSAADEI